MALRRILLFVVGISVTLLCANFLLIQWDTKPSEDSAANSKMSNDIRSLIIEGRKQAENVEKLKGDIKKLEEIIKAQRTTITPVKSDKNHNSDSNNNDEILPILLFACNRPTVTRVLDDLIKHRTSKEKFPIIVSQDCGHQETNDAIQQYKSDILLHLKQPDLNPIPNLNKKQKKLEGYYKVARHYKWGLGQVFDQLKYSAVIIMEDDLNISPDFYDYFQSTYKLLKDDPTLYCISAWNDNGKGNLINNDAELLYRSDFFPGLGWMMLKSTWDELRDKWPIGFWDDWLRQDEQRKGRSCIRPEISRTHTFGAKGISLGQFWKAHLQFITLNSQPVKWLTKDLSYLVKDKYDEKFVKEVYDSPVINLAQLTSTAKSGRYKSVRLQYNDRASFKSIAKLLKLMDDFKEGVPRTAYKGVVPIMYEGLRVYIAPPSDWGGYDKSWK